MKKLHYILLLTTVMCCWSCSSGGGEDEPTPIPTEKIKIEITSSAPVIEQKGGTATVTFTSNASWTATVSESRSVDWCTVSPTSGGEGSVTLTVTTKENDTYNERNASVTIKAGAVSQLFTVRQKQKDALTITSNKVEIKAEGGNFCIETQTNVSVAYEIEEAAKEWITVAGSRGLTTTTLNFTAKANKSLERRQGTITLKGGDGLAETVTVYQEGEVPTIVVSSDDIITSCEGETVIIELKSNVEYAMVLPQVDWISRTESRAISTYTHYLTIAPNDTYNQRNAFVYFLNEAKNLKDSISITQLQKDAIIVAKNEYEVEAESSTLEFSVNTNVDFEISTSVDWIKQNMNSRGLVEKALSFTVEGNENMESREGEITITFGDLKQTIKVIQAGYETIERAALIDFYKSAGGDDWFDKTNWCSDKPLDEWYGISVNGKGRVYGIEFVGNNVSGDFSICLESLLPLKELGVLDIRDNLFGEIPEIIGDFSNLRTLWLSGNQLKGKLPSSISKLSKLRRLLLGDNQLSGDVYDIFSSLSNLNLLSLGNNRFTGKLPEMSSEVMTCYTLHNNLFTGNIPESHIKAFEKNSHDGIYNTEYGWRYEIQGNNLSGEVPAAMVEHRNWVAHWRDIMPQNQGYGFTRVDLPAPQIVVKCYDDSFLDLAEEYKRNKYTIIFRLDPYCPWSNQYVQPIYQLYQKYKNKGLGLVSTTHKKYSMEEMNTLTSIYKDIKVFWETSANQGGADGSWNNNPMSLGAYFYLFRTGVTPYFHVVDNSGNIVFYGSGAGGAECIPQYHKNRDDIYDFVANLFDE